MIENEKCPLLRVNSVVASRLLKAVCGENELKDRADLKVSVLDMQPIDPPMGGGRQRLLGLYHNLGHGLTCQYIGSYDWPGALFRRHDLSPRLEEIDIPLSWEHHAVAYTLAKKAGKETVIDISFGKLGGLSPDYLAAARASIRGADVVIFSHPWVYPLVREELTPEQVVIYDSQNVEGYLRAQLLDDTNPAAQELLCEVVQDEYAVGQRADLIFCCSQEDLEQFQRIYEFSPEKMRILPNGAMAFSWDKVVPQNKLKAKEELSLSVDRLVAIFIGSPYGPNIEAAQFITEKLASALPDVIFVIAGGVGSGMISDRPNVILTGSLSECEKNLWLCASDMAVNPMFSGSGTNIKMFDFMAVGLPIVTSTIGARGISTGGRKAMIVAEPTVAAFVDAIGSLREDNVRAQVGKEARICLEDGYAWERISEYAGRMISAVKRYAGQPRPTFSVVIPTYERHELLNELISCLQSQIERDFEVVIVDQSSSRWPAAENDFNFPLLYFHSPVKGAVRARNTGSGLAQGRIIVFTDDDCLPEESWLLNARQYFEDQNNVGLEGRIVSNHFNDPEWRPVSNVGIEGIGFRTANLMVRSRCFHQLGGFDLDFDRPHFREDTDFGWRLQKLGNVPCASDVEVFHPAQPCSTERESSVERSRFFEKDALLYKKHPERYLELFLREKHYAVTPGFTENLRRGFLHYGVEIPGWMKSYLK